MKNSDLKFVKENKKEIVEQIARLIETHLDGDIVNLYFYLNEQNKMDYGFQRTQDTIMVVNEDSLYFTRDENGRIADRISIEEELDLQIEQVE